MQVEFPAPVRRRPINSKTQTACHTDAMNSNPNADTSQWKQALKWTALALISVVALDWLLDGRLRKSLPGRRKDRTDNLNG